MLVVSSEAPPIVSVGVGVPPIVAGAVLPHLEALNTLFPFPDATNAYNPLISDGGTYASVHLLITVQILSAKVANLVPAAFGLMQP